MNPPRRLPNNLYFTPEKESGILPQETQNTQETKMLDLTTLYPSSSYVKTYPHYCVTVHDTNSFSLRDGVAISPYIFLVTG